MTIVVGTAGHIDHGKTTLLHSLTGIDADRLPEERRRGMTIDVGYAHLALPDGTELDFVDVPGHDRLVGNMLVGAGEIDAALLVVAADDGPRPQTREHLALLDALGVGIGIAVVTKADAVDPERADTVAEMTADLLEGTTLAGSPVLLVSATTGVGLDRLREELIRLRDRAAAAMDADPGPARLAIDRVFAVRGRGTVVTGTLRGGPLARGELLAVVPASGDVREVRVREIQVHNRTVGRVDGGGRTAVNVAGIETSALHRGQQLTTDARVRATDRILVAFSSVVPSRATGRFHAGTAATEAAVGRGLRDVLALPGGRTAGIVRLTEPLALRAGDRFVLRRGVEADPLGGVVLDDAPPRGVSRRRQTAERVAALASDPVDPRARLELHGAIATGSRVELADGVRAAAAEAAIAMVSADSTMTGVRASTALALRRRVTLGSDAATIAATELLDRLVTDGTLVRDGDALRPPGIAARAPDPAAEAALDRLVAALDVPAPPFLADAARAAGCPPAAVRELERAGRIVVIAPDLGYAASRYEALSATALAMARRGPLTPAAFRDATATSRKFVMAVLEDLDRRAILRRTPDGHVPGQRAPAPPSRTRG